MVINMRYNMKKKKNDILTGCLCALVCELLYGLSYIFTKNATDSASVPALLGWRFVIAFIVLSACAAAGVVKIDLKGRNIKPLLLIALLDPVIYFIFETAGISKTTASESGAFLACNPVASLIASSAILKKRPSKRQTAGIITTLAGVLTTVLAVGATASLSVSGYVFLLGAVVLYALYSVFVEKADGFSSIEITYVMLAAGAAVFCTLAVAEAIIKGSITELVALPVKNMGFLTAVIYQGIGCSVLAFFMSNVAISNIGVNRTSSFIGISTVVSIISGVIVLGESFSAYQAIGAAVIVAGIYISNSATGNDDVKER